jgi:hypothetical protein
MSNFGPAQFGPAVFGGEPVSHLFLQIDAELTTWARRLTARGQTDGTSLQCTKFSVGGGGFDPLDYLAAIPVNPDSQALDDFICTDTIDYYEWGAPRCPIFYCFVDSTQVSHPAGNGHIGEIGIIAEINNSPFSWEPDGTEIMYAMAHFPLLVQPPVIPATPTIRYAFRVAVMT